MIQLDIVFSVNHHIEILDCSEKLFQVSLNTHLLSKLISDSLAIFIPPGNELTALSEQLFLS